MNVIAHAQKFILSLIFLCSVFFFIKNTAPGVLKVNELLLIKKEAQNVNKLKLY